MQERLHILKSSFNRKVKLINSRSEIYSSCRHKLNFHRFGADEALGAKKVVLDLSAGNQQSREEKRKRNKPLNPNTTVWPRYTHYNMCIPINNNEMVNNNQTIDV